MTLTLSADLTVAILLVFTLFYVARLNRRLGALRADKAALQTLVHSLTQASQSAEAGIRGLRSAAEEAGRELQKKLQEAQSLRDDLAYMIDRGGGVADRMESQLRSRREEPRGEAPRGRPAEPLRAPAPEPRRAPQPEPKPALNFIQEMAQRLAPNSGAAPSRSERDLMRALAGRRS
ncbi:MAG TPA: DUF6468 domain-containing protein [Stellaceae bacterium]|jgi:hypothetical protein|nr:DUF6468 domain-containing protein [Stellaceae bacterium]